MYEICKDAPDRYIIETFDISNQAIKKRSVWNQKRRTTTKLTRISFKKQYRTSTWIIHKWDDQWICINTKITPDWWWNSNSSYNQQRTDKSITLPPTNLPSKSKRHMYYFPDDFENLTLDCLIGIGVLTSTIAETEPNKIELLKPKSNSDTGPAPSCQVMVARNINWNILFHVWRSRLFSVIMEFLPNLLGLRFLKRNIAVFDPRQEVLLFPSPSMQLKL